MIAKYRYDADWIYPAYRYDWILYRNDKRQKFTKKNVSFVTTTADGRNE